MTVAEGLVFPDVRRCLVDLIEGTTHLGETVTATWNLQAGDYGALAGPFPLVWIGPPRGTEGFIDRVDRVTLECYYSGSKVVEVLESIKASLTGTDIETGHGDIDTIIVVNAPEAVPYQSDTLNKAVMTLDVTTRPLN